MALLKSGGHENPIEIYSSEEDPKGDLEEYYSEEHPSEDVELADEENQLQKVIEDSLESKEFFELFGSKKKKKIVICSRPFS